MQLKSTDFALHSFSAGLFSLKRLRRVVAGICVRKLYL